MDNDNEFTGAELQTLREMCGWDRADFAGRMGVKPETVRFWERGKLEVPDEAINTLLRASRNVRIIAHRLVTANPPVLYRIPGHDLHNAAVTIAAALLPESRIVNGDSSDEDLAALVTAQRVNQPRKRVPAPPASQD